MSHYLGLDRLRGRLDELEGQVKGLKETLPSDLKRLRMSLDGVRKYHGVQRGLIEQRLLALEAGGDGAEGDPTLAPGEPRNLRITGVSGRQVSLAWDALQDDGGSRVTGYEYMVEGACVHDPAQICRVIEPTRVSGTSRTVTVPNVRGRYEFYVRALNAAGAGWWTHPVGHYVDPQRTWRVSLSPSSLTVPEGGEATYRVRLTSDPGQPVWVALHWEGDDDLGNGRPAEGISSLSEQQFKWLLPSNYANEDIYLDPDYTAAWNTGVTITVTAGEDADSENGTLEIHNTVYYVPCAGPGQPRRLRGRPGGHGRHRLHHGNRAGQRLGQRARAVCAINGAGGMPGAGGRALAGAEHVKRLRRKLGGDAADPRFIFTEPRVGYRMAVGEGRGES